MKLHAGDVFKDGEGTLHKIYGAIDDTYTYFFVTNESTNTALRMRPSQAEQLVKGMRQVKG